MSEPTSMRNRRWLIWLPLLGGSAALVILGGGSPGGVADAALSPASTQLRQRQPARPPDAEGFAVIARTDLIPPPSRTERRDLFARRTWTPPPQPVATTPAITTAPALPFQFIGKKHDDSGWEVYLGRGDQTFVVRAGTTIDGAYRVDRIQPPLLAFTYLPLGESQELAIGDAP